MQARPSFHLSDSDLIAAAQILGWLAYPDKPELGISILQQWAIRRGRARGAEWAEESPVRMDAPNRLQERLYSLDSRAFRALQAGEWLSKRIARASGTKIGLAFGAGSRQLARIAGASDSVEEKNKIREIWESKLPVIHLAASARAAIRNAYEREDRFGWHLERTLFWPDWVQEAIAMSEQSARWAAALQLIPLERMIRFHRD